MVQFHVLLFRVRLFGRPLETQSGGPSIILHLPYIAPFHFISLIPGAGGGMRQFKFVDCAVILFYF